MRWAGHDARMGDRRVAHRILVGKSERKSHFPKRRWDNNIKVDFQKVEWELGLD
jgi:hypothetical protein